MLSSFRTQLDRTLESTWFNRNCSESVGKGTFTVHVSWAGDRSVFPAPSVAWTAKVCFPPVRPLSVSGDVHESNDPPSREHWKVDPFSVDENENVADWAVEVAV